MPSASPRPASPGGGGAGGRAPFLDVARGLAILLVVLHHSVIFVDAAHLLPPAWRVVNDELVVLRMPLFFAVSGVLAASAARRPWREVLRHRLALLGWLFLVWSLLRFVWFSLVPQTLNPAETATLAPLVWTPLLPVTGLWYLYAIGLFTVLARLPGRRAPWLLAPAALLSLAENLGLLALLPNYAWHQMARCFVFFLLGWCLKRTVLAAFSRAPGELLALVVVVAGVVLVQDARGTFAHPALQLPISVLAIAGGLALAALLVAVPTTARLAAGSGWLGRRTLPVYLTHEWVVGGLTAVAAVALSTPSAWLPLLWVPPAVVLPLLLHTAVRRAGVGGLYNLPARRPGRRRALGFPDAPGPRDDHRSRRAVALGGRDGGPGRLAGGGRVLGPAGRRCPACGTGHDGPGAGLPRPRGATCPR
ncbi:acyltransferase family protein [Kineococcus gynurae]|uniref:Acyltransferase family protein n=1 Tax=Kineococcus gynurae TaxID=452979 RepID=A0ABV5LQX3_9ACTN